MLDSFLDGRVRTLFKLAVSREYAIHLRDEVLMRGVTHMEGCAQLSLSVTHLVFMPRNAIICRANQLNFGRLKAREANSIQTSALPATCLASIVCQPQELTVVCNHCNALTLKGCQCLVSCES